MQLHSLVMCSSRKNLYPPNGKSYLEILIGRGVLRAKILEAKYEAKLEFLVGREWKTKYLLWGGVWIFSGTTQL